VKARDAVSGENLEEEKPRGDRPHALVNNQRVAERISTRDKSPEGGTGEVGESGQLLLDDIGQTTRGNGWERRAFDNRVEGENP
jgi:hypothetical protein